MDRDDAEPQSGSCRIGRSATYNKANERGYKMIRHIRTTIADASTMDSETARNRQLQEAREENAKLRAALKESMEHIGTAHCSGYKCRLPHCDSCNEDPIDIWDVMPRWIKLLKEGD